VKSLQDDLTFLRVEKAGCGFRRTRAADSPHPAFHPKTFLLITALLALKLVSAAMTDVLHQQAKPNATSGVTAPMEARADASIE